VDGALDFMDDDVLAEDIDDLEDQAEGMPDDLSLAMHASEDLKYASAMNQHIAELRAISGYKASAIIDHTGETLASDSIDPGIEIVYVSAMFIDLFRTASNVCEKTGLQMSREITITTSGEVVVMRSSDDDEKPQVHVIAILNTDGNLALMKMTMKRMIPKLVEDMA
jgi:predicted regulator of Ras-like GTPase activity (Roadblock/LC7/MglB family)